MPRSARTVVLLAVAAAGSALTAFSSPLHAAEAAATPARPPQLKSEAEMLQTLRERLAAKLGGAKAVEPKQPGLVRVTSRAEAGEDAAAPAIHGARPRTATPARVAKAAATAEVPAHAVHWSYAGEAGPRAWGGLKPEFAKCGNGTRQSPIDIKDGIAVDLEPVQFDYRASPFRVVDNGHTVQVNIEPGNAIVARGERFELQQFHFHRPAEERVDGRSFDMSLHLVHQNAEGRLAVVALLLNRSPSGNDRQPVVQAVWNNLPLEKHEEVRTRAVLDLNHILPPDRGYYTYMGSLTTPPCSEGVLWMVMRQPLPIAPEQIEVFARLYPMNARPIQSAGGRIIKQSN